MSRIHVFSKLIRFALVASSIASGITLISGCQRSSEYRHDQDYLKDSTPSYYNKSGGSRSPTQRLESLGQPKKRVVVLDFWNDTPVKEPDLDSFSANELRRDLYNTQKMIIPTDVKSESGTRDFVDGDRIKVAQLIREGRRLGVGVIIIGRISKIVFRQKGDEVGLFREKSSAAAVDLEAKIFDVQAGREILATARSGEASESAMVAFEAQNTESAEYRAELTRLAVRNAAGLLVPDVLKAIGKMTWEGRVAKVAGNKIYVNAGRASGLIQGDILKVLTPGDDVYDPASGAFLGRAQGQLKGTVEVTDFIGTDGAVTEVHTGANFQEGDLVQLY